MPLLADVAVPVPLTHSLTYEVPPSLAGAVRPGARVVCGLGSRRVLGVVLAAGEREAPAGVKLKPIHALIDPEPVLPHELLHFLQELSAYYFAPIGEVLLTDRHGVMLTLPDRDVWTFNAYEDVVEIEESVYLAGSDGPRRTVQMVIYGHARTQPTVQWAFTHTPRARRDSGRETRSDEPELPL